LGNDLGHAYAACERLARTHYENFPVASWLVPSALRPHVAAVYAFARIADDFADEGRLSVAERHGLLDRWLDRLRSVDPEPDPEPARVLPPILLPLRGEPDVAPLVFQALGATMRAKRLPRALFEDLLSAFRQDVSVTRYATWEDLLDYCRRSANPVGRLVLRVFGHDDRQLDAWSDAVCTGLQLANFWQDLRDDYARGRVYVPQEELRTAAAEEADLMAPRVSEPWKRVLQSLVDCTRGFFDAGRPVCTAVPGRLGLELRATWLGGTRILDRIQRADFDVLAARPRLGASDLPWFAWRLAVWPR
jgi:squalene synthase HpnC